MLEGMGRSIETNLHARFRWAALGCAGNPLPLLFYSHSVAESPKDNYLCVAASRTMHCTAFQTALCANPSLPCHAPDRPAGPDLPSLLCVTCPAVPSCPCSCDSVNLGMIKHPEVAAALGGRLYDCVCQFCPAGEAQAPAPASALS